VILTVYLDESGTHDGDGGSNTASSVLVMAGMMGNAPQWARFQYSLNRLKEGYGFTIFHTKKFKDRDGDFKGWSVEKRLKLVSDLTDIIADKLMQGCAISLKRADYSTQYRAEPFHRKARHDTEYGLCFRACLKYLVDEATRRLRNHKRFKQAKLSVVLEHGAKNSGDCERIFFEMKQGYRSAGFDLLDEFTTAKKVDSDPLIAADFLAHTIWSNDPEHFADEQWQEHGDTKKRAGLTHLSFAHGSLEKIREVHNQPRPLRGDSQVASSVLVVANHPSRLESKYEW
jgi:hypothetical protein